jgi:hypothetical protein
MLKGVARMVAFVAAAVLCACSSAMAAVPKWATSCATVNRLYPHGVGKVSAHDHTTGAPPVTTFKRSNAVYAIAKGRDRDHDGVACEQA